jgi:predicted nuclease of restriction endonuclease-like (RecB) superfamily
MGILLYERQFEEGYVSGVVKQLSFDLKKEFPDMGLSTCNLWDMKRFYESYYQESTKLRQVVAVLTWGYNFLLLDEIQRVQEVDFYANKTISKGWFRDLLINAIKMNFYGNSQT